LSDALYTPEGSDALSFFWKVFSKNPFCLPLSFPSRGVFSRFGHGPLVPFTAFQSTGSDQFDVFPQNFPVRDKFFFLIFRYLTLSLPPSELSEDGVLGAVSSFDAPTFSNCFF